MAGLFKTVQDLRDEDAALAEINVADARDELATIGDALVGYSVGSDPPGPCRGVAASVVRSGRLSGRGALNDVCKRACQEAGHSRTPPESASENAGYRKLASTASPVFEGRLPA
jgi:hypothetical protein